MKTKMMMAVGLVGLTFCAVGESVEIFVPANETKVLSSDFGGVLSNPAADPIVKTGEGTLVIDVSRTGATKLAVGTMRLSSSEIALSSAAGDVVIAGGVLDLNGATNEVKQLDGGEPAIGGGAIIRNGGIVFSGTNYFPWTEGTVVLDHASLCSSTLQLFAYKGDTGDRRIVVSNASELVSTCKSSGTVMSSAYSSGFMTSIVVDDHSRFSYGNEVYIGIRKNMSSSGRGEVLVLGGSEATATAFSFSDYIQGSHYSALAVTNSTLTADSVTGTHNGANSGNEFFMAKSSTLNVSTFNPKSRWSSLHYMVFDDCRIIPGKNSTVLENTSPKDQWAVYDVYTATGTVTIDSDYESKVALMATMKGSGTVVKTGSGNLTYFGPQTYTGGTIVSNGTLTLAWDAATAASTGSSKGLKSRKVIEGGDVYVAPEGAIKIAYTNAFAATRSLSVDGTLLVTTNADLTVPVTLVKNFTLGDGAKILVDADSVSATDKVPFLRVKNTYLCGTVKVVDTKGRPWSVKTAAGTDFTELLLKKEQGLTLIVR